METRILVALVVMAVMAVLEVMEVTVEARYIIHRPDNIRGIVKKSSQLFSIVSFVLDSYSNHVFY
jgi:hypothetical protein